MKKSTQLWPPSRDNEFIRSGQCMSTTRVEMASTNIVDICTRALPISSASVLQSFLQLDMIVCRWVPTTYVRKRFQISAVCQRARASVVSFTTGSRTVLWKLTQSRVSQFYAGSFGMHPSGTRLMEHNRSLSNTQAVSQAGASGSDCAASSACQLS